MCSFQYIIGSLSSLWLSVSSSTNEHMNACFRVAKRIKTDRVWKVFMIETDKMIVISSISFMYPFIHYYIIGSFYLPRGRQILPLFSGKKIWPSKFLWTSLGMNDMGLSRPITPLSVLYKCLLTSSSQHPQFVFSLSSYSCCTDPFRLRSCILETVTQIPKDSLSLITQFSLVSFLIQILNSMKLV